MAEVESVSKILTYFGLPDFTWFWEGVYAFATVFFELFFVLAVGVSTFYLLMGLYVVLFARKTRYVEKPFIAKQAPFVSIHIPTYNELAAINCAEACQTFDYPKNKFEIIIGDDSNDPAISEQLLAFANQNKSKNIKLVKRDKNIGYKAGNLNNMAKYSKGEIFVIFDSDFLPKPDFLKRIITPFIYNKNLSAVQARWKPANGKQNPVAVLAANIVEVFHHVVLPFMRKTAGTVVICGSAEAVRRSDWEQLGRWQEGSLTEDIEYSFRLIQENKDVHYLDKLDCECEVPFKPLDLYRQQMRWSYGVISALKQHALATFMRSSVSLGRKFALFVSGVGYIMTLTLQTLFIAGILKWSGVFIFPPQSIVSFVMETSGYVLLTLGPLVIAVTVLFLTKNLNRFGMLLKSTFTVGLIMIYHVNKGIGKALLNKPMQWFLVTKTSNQRLK